MVQVCDNPLLCMCVVLIVGVFVCMFVVCANKLHNVL